MSTRKINLEALTTIRNFTDNWDGAGALPFSDSIVDKAKRILLNLDIEPTIYPMSNNNILFEFNENKKNFQIVISLTDVTYNIFVVHDGGVQEEKTISIAESDVLEVVKKNLDLIATNKEIQDGLNIN